ncbi:potassium transporter TrkG [Yaniella flava]|uniref:Potassium transporter TrkG n=2 Tax=Yaniella flava TaxID=287930 RepID=A0ABP5G3J0_9MICC
MGAMKRQRSSAGARLHHGGGVPMMRKISRALIARPARSAASMFVLAIAVFTVLLSLPFSSAERTMTPLVDAAVTATSAVTVTGLTSLPLDYFSFTGQLIILIAIQLGGLGIVTLGAWLTMLLSRRLALRSKMLSTESMGVSGMGEVPSLLITVVVFTLTIEVVLAAVMLPVLSAALGWGEGSFHAIFYAISAFSNAGFSLSPEMLGHPLIMSTIHVGAFAGALGFPVVYMLYRMVFHKSRMNLHTRLTLEVTIFLLLLGMILMVIFEWNNPDTLGPMHTGDKLHNALFASSMTRSGGFSTFDITDQTEQSLLVTNVLMFIGGGSGSTAGGIKVTTLAVLVLAIVAEVRGDEHIRVHRREIPNSTVRVAVAVVAGGAFVVLTAVIALIAVTGEDLESTVFEALSAFGTVGLTNGLTHDAPPAGQWILIVLMFIGRVGPITFAAGLAARHKPTLYRHATERPIIG